MLYKNKSEVMARTVNDIYDSDRMVIRKRGKNQRKEKKKSKDGKKKKYRT